MRPVLDHIATAEINEIARKLGIKTLEAQESDSADFHRLAVSQIKTALEDAYLAGMVDRLKR